MNIVAIVCALLALIGVRAAAAQTDVILLKNGDRISGIFLNVRGSTLSIHAEAFGTTTIPVGRVTAVLLAKTVMLIARDRPPVHGSLALSPAGDWMLSLDNGTTRRIAASAIVVILPADRYKSLVEHIGHPWQDWTGTANLGFSIQRGNQQTNTLSSSVDARREPPQDTPLFAPHWRSNAHLTMFLSTALEAETSIGSNTLSTSLRQDRLLSPGSFVFGIVQFDHVGTGGLSLRASYGGGTGYDVTWGRGALSSFAGLTFVREQFATGAHQQTAQLLLGEKFRFQLTPRARLDHSSNVYPNLSVLGQYHLDTRTAFDLKLTNRFSLNTGLIDLYLTNPAPGSQRNSFLLTTGITTTF